MACKACRFIIAGITVFGFLFDPEDGGDMFLRNVGLTTTNYTPL
jgi:hypothetical protein